MRRGVNMTYIVMNNGVYGLTKGQFSATADKGSISKKGAANSDELIDLVSLAILMGATFVGRSFSGDKHQLVPLIKAAMTHKGAAFLDVISPCVAFNNHAGSTKSYEYVREHNEALNRLDFIEGREEITTQYEPGTATTVQQHDGSLLRLRKLGEEYDPADKVAAMKRVQEGLADGRGRDRAALPRPDAQGPAPEPQHGRRATQHARHTPTSAPARRRSTASTPVFAKGACAKGACADQAAARLLGRVDGRLHRRLRPGDGRRLPLNRGWATRRRSSAAWWASLPASG